MKKIMYLFVSLMTIGAMAQSKTVKGKVYLDNTPLKDATIIVVEKDFGVSSAPDGSYKIEVQEGDVIRYSFIGLKTVEILVEDVTDILNVTMYADISELDEVTVTDRKKVTKVETQENFDINKSHVYTAFGMRELTKTSKVRILQAENISAGASCILDILRGGISAGVIVSGSCVSRPEDVAISRDGKPFLYDVDGSVTSVAPLFLIASNIERIAILVGPGAAALYGSVTDARPGGRAQSAGGVIIINTKRSGMLFAKSTTDKNTDTARLTDNRYYNDAIAFENAEANISKYLDELQKSKTLEEAKAAYKTNQKAISGSYLFALDAFDYFLNERKELPYAKQVLEDNDAVIKDNPVALKALAYIYEASGYNKEANELYKEVFMLRPQYVQSYFDLARSYREIEDYQRAATMLMRHDYLLEEGFLKTNDHFSGIVDRELNNLLLQDGDNVVSINKKKKYVLEDGFVGTRLVFEWVDSEAEFDLQFVNPENRYSTWEHTINSNAERIQDEKRIGYNVEEYLIDEALKGTWQVNVKYLGNKTLTPSYLKATVYYNYGSSSQRKESTFFKLQEKNLNLSLMRIENSSVVVTR